MSGKSFISFIKIARKESKRLSPSNSFWIYLKYYIQWKKHLGQGRTSLEDGMPWMNFKAISFLNKVSKPFFKVFEYGSGGSTFFWSNRVSYVYSVEHDKTWAENVILALNKQSRTNTTIFFIPPEKDLNFSSKKIDIPLDYISSDEDSANQNYERYVRKISDYPENHFDIVVVDGRARPACIMAGKTRVKPGGYLVIDNTEREYYLINTLPVLESEGWIKHDFVGPVPYLRHFCKTTIFQRTHA
jgi:hypothetical protein